MNLLQRIIKYCAMGFAIFLSVVIFVLIMTAGASMVYGVTAFGEEKERMSIEEQYTIEEAQTLGLKQLLVDCSAEITVETGEEFYIHAENVPEEYQVSCEDGKLVVRDTRKMTFSWVFQIVKNQSKRERVTVVVPKGYLLTKTTIKSGSGAVQVTDLATEALLVESGSGTVNLTRVIAETTGVESGSGRVKMEDCMLGEFSLDSGSGAVEGTGITVENVRLDSGSGRVRMEGVFSGSCEFETGSGALSLYVRGREEDYRIKADCGSGTFRINGKKRDDGSYGNNKKGEFKIDSGSGAVNVEFLPSEE